MLQDPAVCFPLKEECFMTVISPKSGKTGTDYTELLKAVSLKSREIGLIPLGFSTADQAPGGEKSFSEHLRNGIPAGVYYLARNQEVRNNPALILPDCGIIMSFALPYFQELPYSEPDSGRISIYALGRDYHRVLRKKLNIIGSFLKDLIPEIQTRAITDSAPFYEQFFAEITGSAIRGRNNLVRIEEGGSWIFLGELLTSLKAEISENSAFNCLPRKNCPPPCPPGCDRCRRCCPGKAFTPEGFKIEKCLSYLTIENPEEIPDEMIEAVGNRIYGCDECQLSCPENRRLLRSKKHKSPELIPDSDLKNRYSRDFLKLTALLDLTDEEFLKVFAGSPIHRIGYQAFMRNVFAASANAPGNPELLKKLRARIGTVAYPRTLEMAIQAQLRKLGESHHKNSPAENNLKLQLPHSERN